MNWIAGTLELRSKVRYGLTSRGVPLFRFIPYDRRIAPMAVGCSMRNLFYNVHAIVEPVEKKSTGLGHAHLVQNLGVPTPATERQLLLSAFAYDNQKELRPSKDISTEKITYTNYGRYEPPGYTFNIDPPGCRDVDDTFTFEKIVNGWRVHINIADVSEFVEKDSHIDLLARRRATSFYSPSGECLCPMLPANIEESASLLPGSKKPTLSLAFNWIPNLCPEPTCDSIKDIKLIETVTSTDKSYTYDEANSTKSEELSALESLSNYLGKPGDSHTWVQNLMIFYNTYAGNMLRSCRTGILRRHSEPELERLKDLPEEFKFLAFESAEFCKWEPCTKHYGLGLDAYAYATSPIRRYVDIINQRILKKLLTNNPMLILPDIPDDLVKELNRREKQARAFSRDLFFSDVLTTLTTTANSVKGVVVKHDESKKKFHVWVPDWKRVIKVRHTKDTPMPKGDVVINWYESREQADWKNRIVFAQV